LGYLWIGVRGYHGILTPRDRQLANPALKPRIENTARCDVNVAMLQGIQPELTSVVNSQLAHDRFAVRVRRAVGDPE
jgi:hypothetical protein